MNLTNKQTTRMILLFCLTYMISYITRINYSAVISEMESAMQISKQALSIALTGSFITYGAGQIVSGIAGDRFSPKKLVFYGLGVTSLMNLLIPLCTSPWQMLVVWSINGVAQAFMWPPIVKIMVSVFPIETYKRATVTVSCGSSIGTIMVYLVSPLLISIASWKLVFILCGICGIIMMGVWQKFCINVNPSPVLEPNTNIKTKTTSTFISPLFIMLMLSIVCIGILRDGVSTWMPSYISETYNTSNVIAILSGIVLPIFSMLSYEVSLRLYRNKFSNPITCAAVIFVAGALSAFMLIIVTGKTAVLSILFMALITASMHGTNLMLISMVPAYFSATGNVSTVSGVLNSCVYVGSAISTYGVAVLTENMGWTVTILTWFAVAVIGVLLCLLCIKPWNKTMNNY